MRAWLCNISFRSQSILLRCLARLTLAATNDGAICQVGAALLLGCALFLRDWDSFDIHVTILSLIMSHSVYILAAKGCRSCP